MTIRRFALLLVLALVAPVLAACGGDDDGGGNGDGGGEEAAGLTQEYSQDGLSFCFPEGWVSSIESDGALIASSQDVLDAASSGDNAEIPDGGQAYTILGFPAPVASGISPAQMLELLAAEQAGEEGTEMSDPEDVTIGDASGVKVTVTDAATKGEGAIYILRPNDDVMIMVIGLASEGDYDDALTQEIAANVSYAPPTE